MTKEMREKLLNAGIESEMAIERFMGNESLYIKFLLRFENDESYFNLCEAMKQKDCHNAFVAAHMLKGVCGNLSIKRMESILREQVEYLRNEDFDKAQEMMDSLGREYEKVKEALEWVREDV